jgi:hypothetical protein
MERCKANLGLSGFSKRQIQKSYLWFDYYLYKGYKPTYKLLAKVLALRIRKNYFYRRMKYNYFLKWIRQILRSLYSID